MWRYPSCEILAKDSPRNSGSYLQDLKMVRDGGVGSIHNTGNTVEAPSRDGIILSCKAYNHPGKLHGAPRLVYCSISWEQIFSYTNDGIEFTRLDRIAMAMAMLAFTCVQRVGSFLPKNAKEGESFS